MGGGTEAVQPAQVDGPARDAHAPPHALQTPARSYSQGNDGRNAAQGHPPHGEKVHTNANKQSIKN